VAPRPCVLSFPSHAHTSRLTQSHSVRISCIMVSVHGPPSMSTHVQVNTPSPSLLVCSVPDALRTHRLCGRLGELLGRQHSHPAGPACHHLPPGPGHCPQCAGRAHGHLQDRVCLPHHRCPHSRCVLTTVLLVAAGTVGVIPCQRPRHCSPMVVLLAGPLTVSKVASSSLVLCCAEGLQVFARYSLRTRCMCTRV
jgi:hypothetical protein